MQGRTKLTSEGEGGAMDADPPPLLNFEKG